MTFIGHHCPWTLLILCGTIVTPRGIVIFFVANTFATQFCSSLGTAVTRLNVLEPSTQV